MRLFSPSSLLSAGLSFISNPFVVLVRTDSKKRLEPEWLSRYKNNSTNWNLEKSDFDRTFAVLRWILDEG
ncbi:MAG: hypothetical protein D6687_10235 [Acidobacteria bacterium]|nr:MAG: hypothetical protein D6687_10235 [Acidobacteriota bacterium]GIU81159.1 MAG: hypothetical protein KatS3mg006_0223 [Pyrinomonadaceae bacterium]